MSALEIWPEPPTVEGDTVTVSASLDRPGGGGRFRLWYRLPSSFRDTLSDSCDPFVQAAMFTAMRTASRVVIHGRASPSLLRNLVEFQMAWTSWKPDLYHPVELCADTEVEREPADDAAALMVFSGGADSAFTAWRHRRGCLGRERYDLRAGVLVHGFDIPLEDVSGYEGAAVGSAAMLASLGLPLVRLATNFRDLGDDWVDAHGAGLASCLTVLRGSCGAGLIASSYPYATPTYPYGSNPLTDVMFSSRTFRIVHDGAKYNRLEKLRALVGWPEAMQHLRVCWEGEHRDRNCCRCQKCVSNMLHLRILGQSLPACFPRDIGDREIALIRCRDLGMIESMERLARTARRKRVSASWVRMVRLCATLNRLSFGLRLRKPE